MKFRNTILWISAIVLTISISVYQRMTGPSKPVRGKINIKDKTIRYKLLRTEVSGKDAILAILTNDETIRGHITFKRYKSYDEWQTEPMSYSKGVLTASVPTQPPAGKVMYKIVLTDSANIAYPLTEEAVIIRYKGDVPAFFLVPHIIFMFISLLLALRLLLQSIFVKETIYLHTLITFCALVLGGLVFGPIVQKYAFGAYWTGFPFGHDLTDNKTAITVLFWAIALFSCFRKKQSARWWVLIASLVLLGTYLIPHSMFGSELDFTKM